MQSCLHVADTTQSYTILQQNLLSIIDTVAYDYNSLRPSPNMPRLEKRRTEYPVGIYSNFIDIHLWEKDIVESLKNDTLKEKQKYMDLLKSASKEIPAKLDLKKLGNIGLYQFQLSDNEEVFVKRESNCVGYIKCSEVIHNQDIAMMVVTISYSMKSGVEKLILFEKNKDHWIIVKQIDLSIL